MPNAAAILQSAGLVVTGGLLDATRSVAPIANALEAFEMQGTKYLTLSLAALPSADGFKNLDEGFIASRGAFAMGEVQAYFINTGVKEPVDSTDLWNKNNAGMIARGDVDDWVTSQIKAKLKVEWTNIDKQIIKGLSNSLKGFIGLRDALPVSASANVYSLTDTPADDNYVRHALNVGGTTPATGSRIYLIRNHAEGVSLRMGGPTGLAGFLNFGDVARQFADEADAGDGNTVKTNEYYITRATGYLGLSIFGSSEGSTRRFTQRVARVAFNITADPGKTATEAVLDKLIRTIPPESRDNLMFLMSERSGQQVADSKAGNTQVNIMVSSGDAARRSFTSIPDLPESHRGIPIVYSDQIANNDTLVTPA